MPELPGGTPAPAHAYVPGQTARHPEGWFDPLKTVDADPFDSPAMRAGLDYLHAGYFWECHEVLEAVWLALPDSRRDPAGIAGLGPNDSRTGRARSEW